MDILSLTTALLDNLPFYAYIKSVEGKFLYVNKKNSDFLPIEEFIGKTDFEILPFEMAKNCVNHDLEVIRTKKPVTRFELLIVDNQPLHVETYKTPLFDEHQNIIAICCYTKDITALKNENERAGSITQMLASLETSEMTSLTLFDYDLIQDKLVWNSKFYQFYELDPNQFDGKINSIFELIHPQDRQSVVSKLYEAFEQKDVHSIKSEFRMITGKNNLKYIWCKAQIQRDKDGIPIRFLVIHLDITHTKKTEESLKKISNRLELAVQSGSMGFWNLNLENMSLNWDDQMYRLYEIEDKNMVMTYPKFLELIYENDLSQTLNTFESSLKNTNQFRFSLDFRIKTKSQKIKYIFSQGQIERDEYGSPTLCTGINIDISASKFSEIQTKKLSLVNKIGTIGNWDYDFIYDKLFYDDRMFELYGLDSKTFTHNFRAWADSLPSETRQSILERYTAIWNNPEVKNFSDEFEIIRQDSGKRVYIQVHAEIQRNENNEPIHMSGINLDITRRKIQEQKITENERLLKTLTDTSPVGIFRVNTKGVMKYITGAWEEITYISIENSLNRLWYANVYEEDQANTHHEWKILQKYNDFLSIECRFREITNCKFNQCYSCAHWVLIQLVPEYSSYDNNELLGYIGTITNITERKRSEKYILELNQTLEKRIESEVARNMQQERILLQQSKLASMGEMIGNIAHQWRQPLTALSLIISNLKDSYEYNEFNEDVLNDAVHHSTLLILKMSHTIDDFRNFFRPNKEKMNFSLQKQIVDVVQLLEASFKSNNIILDYSKLQTEEIELWGYPNEFSQAILNVISNAKDVLVERKIKNPKIELEVYSDKSNGYVVISDNGGGIDPKIFPHIFDPYFTTKDNGTGIGLYMTKLIIEQNMNGSINIYSDDEKTHVTIKNTLYRQNIHQNSKIIEYQKIYKK